MNELHRPSSAPGTRASTSRRAGRALHPRRPLPLAALLAAAVAAVALAPSGASARPPDEPRLVSGPTPLAPSGTPGACGSAAELQGWDQEPTLAATRDGQLVTAWTQDHSDAISVAYSGAGRHWQQVLPRTTACTGGVPGMNSAYDPWLAVGPAPEPSAPDLVYLSFALAGDGGRYGTAVVRSLDAGKTWSDPVLVDELPAPASGLPNPEYLDGSTVTADPRQPGRAYVTWRGGNALTHERHEYLSTTSDGGLHWSAPVVLPAEQVPVSGNVVVLADGTLVNVSVEVPPQAGFVAFQNNGPSTIMASRSVDHGATWSEPVRVAAADPTLVVLPRTTVGPDQTVYVAWQHADPLRRSFTLDYVTSTDGGVTWSTVRTAGAAIPGAPAMSAHGTLASAPSFAVTPGGALGIGFYDHRNDPPRSGPPQVTDSWFRSSTDGGRTWSERHVAGPFDQTDAPSDSPVSTSGVLGDFQGIAPVRDGFALTYAVAGQSLASPPTDIFFSHVRP